ncbi:hypothetical protein HGRIS_004379 [Hohenbuehelia grisea]|uniref:Uncharacterized protein n=1 Tax=Hohenbuehelia grisea TaxID=104357 RepID=A0ABR3JCG1_9AGAR
MRHSSAAFLLFSLLGSVVGMPVSLGSTDPNGTIAGNTRPGLSSEIFPQDVAEVGAPDGEFTSDTRNTATSASCPVPNIRLLPSPLPYPLTSEGLSKRGGPDSTSSPPAEVEYLGYIGTHSALAKFYLEHGFSGVPLTNYRAAFGIGMYITDSVQLAHGKAIQAYQLATPLAKPESGPLYPSICAIFARNSANFRWRGVDATKVFLPPSTSNHDYHSNNAQDIAASEAYSDIQEKWIKDNLMSAHQLSRYDTKVIADNVVKLSTANWAAPCHPESKNQMRIPRHMVRHLHVHRCISYDKDTVGANVPTFQELPRNFDYREKYADWNIYGSHFDR